MGKKIKLLMYGVFDAGVIQAQSRDALHWSLYLDKQIVDITAFYMGKVDPRISKQVSLIKLSRNLVFRNVQIIYQLMHPKYTHILFSQPSPVVIFYLAIKKRISFFSKKIMISLVNRLPYERKYQELLYDTKFHQFAISTQIQKDFLKITGRTIPIINLVYDLNRFFPASTMKKNRVICVGSMQIRKNPFLFANLAKQFPNIEFLWIGDGYYFPWIEEKKERVNIANLRLIKKMEQSQLSIELRDSTVFLFPSIHEGFPNVIVEALASGLPVITMSAYGPDAVIDGYNGYVVEDEFEMKDKLEKLLSNDSLLKDLSNNAVESAKKYDGERAVKQLQQFVLSI